MKLSSLKLTNFRQFKSASVDFASDAQGKVTFIHGENTQGKSALLAAFRWVLHGYEGIANSIQDPDVIVNREAVELEPGAFASVELIFTTTSEDGLFHVVATRTIEARNQTIALYRDGSIKLSVTNQSGVDGTYTLKDADAQAYLSSIIPSGLLDLLFFSGEAIDKLSTGGSSGIGEAVRTILGFTVLERAIQNLTTARSRFEESLRVSANDQLQKKIDQKKRLSLQRDNIAKNLKDFETYLIRLKSDALELSKELQLYDDVKGLASDQIRLTALIEAERSNLALTSQSLRDFIKDSAFTIVSRRAASEGAKLELELRERGDFPSAVSQQFIDKLLHSNQCICGRGLEAGSPEFLKVTSLRSSKARGAEFHDAAEAVSFFLREITEKHDDRNSRLDSLRKECLRRNAAISSNLLALEHVQDQIKLSSVDDIKIIQDKISKVNQEIGKTGESISNAKIELDKLEPQIQKFSKEIAALAAQMDETRVAQARIGLINDSIVSIQELIERGTLIMREKLNELISIYFRQYNNVEGEARIERVPRGQGLADDFMPVALVKNLSGDWVVETGVNRAKQQCLSIAYIRSVLSVASKLDDIATGGSGLFSSESYPIVMDAPFGVLTEGPAVSVCSSFRDFDGQIVCLINYANYKLLSHVLDDASFVARKYYLQSFVQSNPGTRELFGATREVFSIFPAGSHSAQLYSSIQIT